MSEESGEKQEAKDLMSVSNSAIVLRLINMLLCSMLFLITCGSKVQILLSMKIGIAQLVEQQTWTLNPFRKKSIIFLKKIATLKVVRGALGIKVSHMLIECRQFYVSS
jgi:hypothetical protein